MTIEQMIQQALSEGSHVPRRDVEDLLAHLLGMSWSELLVGKDKEVSEAALSDWSHSWSRLKQGEPLAYITGSKEFYGIDFYVNPSVLIPRPETELIIEEFLDRNDLSNPKILDLGCGSGCIGLTVAKKDPPSEVYLIDVSPAAILVAEKNKLRLGIENATLIEGEVGSPQFSISSLKGQVDFVLANPPYIENGDKRVSQSVDQYEPHLALYADNKGMNWIHKWLTWSYDYMKPEAIGIFEFGEGQAKDVCAAVKKENYRLLEVIKDYSDIERLVVFQK